MEDKLRQNLESAFEEKGTDNKMKKYDRLADWDKFAQEMHDYIESFTISKYGGNNEDDFDLMAVTEPRIAIWNVFKYVWRLWKKRGKRNDIYKIVHYAQIAWTQANGDMESLGIIGEEKSG